MTMGIGCIWCAGLCRPFTLKPSNTPKTLLHLTTSISNQTPILKSIGRKESFCIPTELFHPTNLNNRKKPKATPSTTQHNPTNPLN